MNRIARYFYEDDKRALKIFDHLAKQNGFWGIDCFKSRYYGMNFKFIGNGNESEIYEDTGYNIGIGSLCNPMFSSYDFHDPHFWSKVLLHNFFNIDKSKKSYIAKNNYILDMENHWKTFIEKNSAIEQLIVESDLCV